MSRVPWSTIVRGAIDLASVLLGAFIASRKQEPAPAPPPKPVQPVPHVPDLPLPDRADDEIAARGHAGIDARFPAPPPPPTTEPAPAPLHGAALRGVAPADPDATEPDEDEPSGPRDMP